MELILKKAHEMCEREDGRLKNLTIKDLVEIRNKYGEHEEKIVREIFKLLKTEFFHVGTDEFDEVREFYKIEGVAKDFYQDLLYKVEEIEIIPYERDTPIILISDTQYDIYDWYFDADPENSLDIDRENYEIKYSELD